MKQEDPWEKLAKAWHELWVVIIKELHLKQIIDWIARKL